MKSNKKKKVLKTIKAKKKNTKKVPKKKIPKKVKKKNPRVVKKTKKKKTKYRKIQKGGNKRTGKGILCCEKGLPKGLSLPNIPHFGPTLYSYTTYVNGILQDMIDRTGGSKLHLNK